MSLLFQYSSILIFQMRITYVTHTRFPVQKAHGKQIAEVCSALAALGHQVTLVCPNVSNAIGVDAFTYFDIPKNFRIEKLKHVDATTQWWVPGILHFTMNMSRYRRALRAYLQSHRSDLLYTRLPSLVPVLTHSGTPVYLELHALPKRGRKRFADICNRSSRVICLTELMKKELLTWGVNRKKVMVEPDGVDLSRYKKLPDLQSAKKKAKNFPDDRPVVGYSGGLYTRQKIEKGVSVLIDALILLRRNGVNVGGVIAGGWGSEVDAFVQKAKHAGLESDILFHGHVPAAQVPLHLCACDVLVYPAPASNHPYFQRDTSPLKLFEYLAAGRPIVCADLPPLREIVDETVVTFFTPGDGASLAHHLDQVLKHPKEADAKAKKGRALVQKFSWDKRMERILR